MRARTRPGRRLLALPAAAFLLFGCSDGGSSDGEGPRTAGETASKQPEGGEHSSGPVARGPKPPQWPTGAWLTGTEPKDSALWADGNDYAFVQRLDGDGDVCFGGGAQLGFNLECQPHDSMWKSARLELSEDGQQLTVHWDFGAQQIYQRAEESKLPDMPKSREDLKRFAPPEESEWTGPGPEPPPSPSYREPLEPDPYAP